MIQKYKCTYKMEVGPNKIQSILHSINTFDIKEFTLYYSQRMKNRERGKVTTVRITATG